MNRVMLLEIFSFLFLVIGLVSMAFFLNNLVVSRAIMISVIAIFFGGFFLGFSEAFKIFNGEGVDDDADRYN